LGLPRGSHVIKCPPPHSHPWDEAFYVIEDQAFFGVDTEQDLVASAGTLVHIPGGSTLWSASNRAAARWWR
jgi:quercetin dioxygenase-like cupin family protein